MREGTNFKTLWAWFCATFGPAVVVYLPDIAGWKVPPNEHHGQAVIAVLVGIGLINMKRPQDHTEGRP